MLKEVLKNNIRYTEPKSLWINIKSNFMLIISAISFMCLNVRLDGIGLVSLFLSFIAIICVSSQFKSVFSKLKTVTYTVKAFSAISAAGICYYSRYIFLNGIFPSSLVKAVFDRIGLDRIVTLKVLSLVAVFLSFIAVFALVSLLLDYVMGILKEMFGSLKAHEIVFYALIVIVLLVFICFAFFGSNAFWGTNLVYDVIYTSDSPNLVSENAYLRLYHQENDLRQPLFAVFAAPFVGIGYALSVPLSHFDPVFTPLLMNFVQVLMLLAANLMLAKILNLNTTGRVCFMLLSSLTYTTLLFSVMMEQYIVAYFWLILVIYSYIKLNRASAVSLSAAGGTLLTGLVLLPTSFESSLLKTPKEIRQAVIHAVKSVFCFIVFLISFGRSDVILGSFKTAKALHRFANGEPLIIRIKQYFTFVSSCFIAPDAIAGNSSYLHHISWKLNDSAVTHINILGVVIIALCILSFILNRKKKLTVISALWVCFSAILLCFVGWGSAENGMILYSLYFGWAFFVLLFQLVDYVSQRTGFKPFTPIVSCLLIGALLFYNVPGIRDMLSFAFTYYPY